HVPVLVHVQELTQPQGHSSSGSHERYKTHERLDWEAEYDCNLHFKNWLLSNGYASEEELIAIENEAKEVAKIARNNAWKAVREELDSEFNQVTQLLERASKESSSMGVELQQIITQLK